MNANEANAVNGDFGPSREAASQGEFIAVVENSGEASTRRDGSSWRESSVKLAVREVSLRVKVLSFREILEGESLRLVGLETLGTNQTVAVPWQE